MSPWHFVGLFLTEGEARESLTASGDGYILRHGSHRVGSDDFTFES